MKIILILLSALLMQGNQSYSEGNYSEASSIYQQVLNEEGESAEVYYNLGNAYFKQGELAQSILAYERCLRIKPNMKDAQYNLKFAQSQIVDNINDSQAFFLSTWLQKVRNSMKEGTWMMISIITFIFMLAGLLFFALSREENVRRCAFYSAIAALIISVIGIANAGSLHKRDALRAEAIITQGIVNAKASPDRSGTELFTLHEGTRVVIEEVIGDWCNIHVGNNVGWVLLSNLERI